MIYIPTHLHSIFSCLDGFGKINDIVKRAVEINAPAIAITDHGNAYAHYKMIEACKKAKIKPILGVELYVAINDATIKDNEHRNVTHMVVWAKNKSGWRNLQKLISQSNSPDYYYYKPRIHLNTVDSHVGIDHFLDGNVLGMSGHQGSLLANLLVADITLPQKEYVEQLKKAYSGNNRIKDPEYYRQFLRDGWLDIVSAKAVGLESMFGKGNFYIELQNEFNINDKLTCAIHPLIIECLRLVGKNTGIDCLASVDAHYVKKSDAALQRLMLLINMRETEKTIVSKIENDEEGVMTFFGSDEFYIHSPEEMISKGFTEEELNNTVKLAEKIEIFDIKQQPIIPEADIPDYPNEQEYLSYYKNPLDKYLMYLCVEGAKKLRPWEKAENNKQFSRQNYWDRLLSEIDVIAEAGLAGYFLVVRDYCLAADYRPEDHSFDWEKNLKNGGKIDSIPRAFGRGSSAGCLISYFLNITKVNPLPYDLIFSRFYNKGRNSPGHISYPDIDSDFAIDGREWIIDYLKYKYGVENVSQIITFHRIQGKAAIKDIFRVKDIPNSYEIANEICKSIPNEAEISDEIQAMRASGDEDYGIIRWAIDNSSEMAKYYSDEKLKPIIDQAMKCENIIRGSGKHPSGVIISNGPIKDSFPIAYDAKHKESVIALDMNEAAELGGIKMDLLGTAVLDKLRMTQDLVNKVYKKKS